MMNKTNLYQQQYTDAAHLVRRIIMFVALFLTFVVEISAQGMPDVPKSGRRDGVVYLNDLEDHRWTYYSGVDASVDGGDYNKNYVGKLYSPNSRNVKITYNGVNGIEGSSTVVKVSIDNENETSFVYYKTLEQGSAEGEYPYTVISNPFSVRPSVGSGNSKVYYGFNGWKIESGGEFIKGYKKDDILPLDAEIVFENLPYNEVNCISAEIVFQTTWVPAQLTYLSKVKNDNTDYPFGVENNITKNVPTTYENNFLVIDKGYSGNLTMSQPCTIMMVEPDGIDDYRDKAFTKLITPMQGGNTKIEFAHWQPNGSINARGRNLTIGRGMKMDGTKRTLYGSYTNKAVVNQILKIESGVFKSFSHYGESKDVVPSSIVKQWITFGCDYDRAGADNNKLDIQGDMLVGKNIDLPTDSEDEICRVYSLSGKFMSTRTVSGGSTTDSYYLRVRTNKNEGHVYMEILGGNWKGIAGGFGDEHTPELPAFTFRMRGGHIQGSVYGAGQYLGSSGTRTFVITGGIINGWIAAGANGTNYGGGEMNGASYIYVGGTVKVDSKGSSGLINRAHGGNVFGAGCGYCENSTAGQVTLGTNVVIADNAYVERGVYGGGSFGFCPDNKTSNVYITGGTIAGMSGGVKTTITNKKDEYGDPIYDAKPINTIHGGVYGGACQNKGGSVNIYMIGGMVNGGLYGGSNASGTLSGNVNVKITGGTIGGMVNGNQTNANVYGGGYGSGTAVNGAVSMTLGNSGASTGATVNGDVYGGGAEGKVNNTISVNINAATINGNLYGGGHGASAKVTNSSTVAMSGGSVNNVFGGGNAAELGGNSTVTIASGNVAGNVYGGGNQAEVKGQTKVVVGKNR